MLESAHLFIYSDSTRATCLLLRKRIREKPQHSGEEHKGKGKNYYSQHNTAALKHTRAKFKPPYWDNILNVLLKLLQGLVGFWFEATLAIQSPEAATAKTGNQNPHPITRLCASLFVFFRLTLYTFIKLFIHRMASKRRHTKQRCLLEELD